MNIEQNFSSVERPTTNKKNELQREAYLAEFILSNAAPAEEVEAGLPTILQPIDFRDRTAPRDLVFRTLAGVTVFGFDGALLVASASIMSFDTYFGSFYETYWAQHTAIRQIGISIAGVGRAAIKVLRQRPNGIVEEVTTQRFDLSKESQAFIKFEIDRLDPRGARIFFDLITAESEFALTHISFATLEAPIRHMRLGIGLCTYNREPFLENTVQTIAASKLIENDIDEVIIVNQGNAFSSPYLVAIAGGFDSRIRVVSQDNIGGAGGFTRCLHELATRGTATHVLFMDDDIRFSAASLRTAVAFASYSTTPTPVGGAMLDLFRPNMIHEAGAKLVKFDWLEPLRHNLDAAQPATLSELASPAKPDYNAWWFFLFPLEILRASGYPLPVFIKFDDVEFGTRLSREYNIETICLSPVSVWHEPFYAKAPNWSLFYSFRNNLILEALHRKNGRLPSVKQVTKRITSAVLRLNYLEAALMILALHQFLDGPDKLLTAGKEIHEEVLNEARKYQLSPARELPILSQPKSKHRPRSALERWRYKKWSTIRRLLARSPSSKIPLVRFGQDTVWNVIRFQQYILCGDGPSPFQLELRFDRKKARNLCNAAEQAIKRYRAEHALAESRWQDALPRLTSARAWSQIFSEITR